MAHTECMSADEVYPAMQFKIGDIVTLKSGGPKMTVTFVNQGEGKVFCAWFVVGNFALGAQNGMFPPEALER